MRRKRQEERHDLVVVRHGLAAVEDAVERHPFGAALVFLVLVAVLPEVLGFVLGVVCAGLLVRALFRMEREP